MLNIYLKFSYDMLVITCEKVVKIIRTSVQFGQEPAKFLTEIRTRVRFGQEFNSYISSITHLSLYTY